MAEVPTTVIVKEMGFTHKDFYRDIDRVLGVDGYDLTANGVVSEDGDKRLQIDLSDQTERKIALFTLPVTRVSLTFGGYDEAEIKTFMALYDRVFRRGGG